MPDARSTDVPERRRGSRFLWTKLLKGCDLSVRRLRVLSLAAWLLAAAFASVPQARAAERYALLGAPAPDFAARAISGKNVRLSEHRGDVVVVAFWSGRCNVCRAQLAALDRIAQTYASAGLVVVSINLDDNVQRSREFAAAQNVSFAMVAEPSKEIGRQFQVDALPMAVFIDRAGNVRRARREWKPQDEASYVRELRVLLNE
jgi:peroxiredoxin